MIRQSVRYAAGNGCSKRNKTDGHKDQITYRKNIPNTLYRPYDRLHESVASGIGICRGS